MSPGAVRMATVVCDVVWEESQSHTVGGAACVGKRFELEGCALSELREEVSTRLECALPEGVPVSCIRLREDVGLPPVNQERLEVLCQRGSFVVI